MLECKQVGRQLSPAWERNTRLLAKHFGLEMLLDDWRGLPRQDLI
jgi:hypothetical protein